MEQKSFPTLSSKLDLILQINDLTMRERLALSLKYQDELNFAEIAVILRCDLEEAIELHDGALKRLKIDRPKM